VECALKLFLRLPHKEDEMTDRSSNNTTKIAILLIAPVLAGIALFALRPKEEKVAEPPKPVVQKPIEQPPPPAPVVENEAAAKEMDQARDTLLGLNKPVVKPEQEPVQERVAVTTKKKRVVREETSESVEDMYPPRRDELDDGGLSDQKFRETIESWRGMRNCVETSKVRTARTSGALRMSLKINGAGDVLGGRVFDESNDAARKVGRCVERQFASLKFPAFETRAPMVVKEAKFVF
jgi:hypothetical protein